MIPRSKLTAAPHALCGEVLRTKVLKHRRTAHCAKQHRPGSRITIQETSHPSEIKLQEIADGNIHVNIVMPILI
jgi:hypothetical protein